MRKYELNICKDPPIKQHTNYAVPLSIILSNEVLYNWYYEHFIQVFSISGADNARFRVLYADNRYPFEELLSFSEISLKDLQAIPDITEYAIESISENFYLKVFVDSYYIRNKAAFMSHHKLQIIIIYGYDIDKEIFKGLSFNSNTVFTVIDIGFNELKDAFNSALQSKIEGYSDNDKVSEPIVEKIKLKDIDEYKFNLEFFNNSLEDYLLSNGQNYRIRNSIKTRFIRQYGINAYKDFHDHLFRVINDDSALAYHDFHIFWEHRAALYERLNFIASEYNAQQALNPLIDSYLSIVKASSVIRNKYMKSVIKSNPGGNQYSQIRDKAALHDLALRINNVLDTEQVILTSVLNICKNII